MLSLCSAAAQVQAWRGIERNDSPSGGRRGIVDFATANTLSHRFRGKMATRKQVRRALEETAREIPKVMCASTVLILASLGIAAGALYCLIGLTRFMLQVGARPRYPIDFVVVAIFFAVAGLLAGGALLRSAIGHARDIVVHRVRHGRLRPNETDMELSTRVLHMLPTTRSRVIAALGISPPRVAGIVSRLRIAGLVCVEEDGMITRGATRLVHRRVLGLPR